MANLSGQPIRATNNYKGLMTIGTNITAGLTTTLKAVGDGMGGYSPLQLSTDSLKITSSVNGNVSLIFENTSDGGFGQLWNAGNGLSTYTLQWRGFNTTGAGGRIYPEGMFIGAQSAPSARLHVRGDGINPVQRWQNGDGTDLAVFTNAGLLSFFNTGQGIDFYGQGIKFLDSIGTIDYSNAGSSTLAYHRFRSPSSSTTGNQKVIGIESNFGAAAGNATFRPLFLEYTINNSGAQTGTATGIFLNATETALNGMTHNLMDLQVEGVSRFKVSNTGLITIPSGGIRSLAYNDSFYGITLNNGTNTNPLLYLRGNGNGKLGLYNNSETGFDMLQFGGSTNTFPALKRNGATLEVVTADGLSSAAIVAQTFSTGLGSIVGSNYFSVSDVGWYRPAANQFGISLNGLNNVHFSFSKTDDTSEVKIIKGASDPEGAVTAPQGSVYFRTGGGAGASFYVKESGAGNTGWVGK